MPNSALLHPCPPIMDVPCGGTNVYLIQSLKHNCAIAGGAKEPTERLLKRGLVHEDYKNVQMYCMYLLTIYISGQLIFATVYWQMKCRGYKKWLCKETQRRADSNLLPPFERHDFVSCALTSGKFARWIVKHLRADKSQKRFSSKLGLACPAGDLAAWVIKYEWTYKAVFSLTIRRCETVTERQTHLNEACNQIKVWLRQNIYGRAEFVDCTRKKTTCRTLQCTVGGQKNNKMFFISRLTCGFFWTGVGGRGYSNRYFCNKQLRRNLKNLL